MFFRTNYPVKIWRAGAMNRTLVNSVLKQWHFLSETGGAHVQLKEKSEGAKGMFSPPNI